MISIGTQASARIMAGVQICHPTADEVYLVGDFNQWRVPGVPMRQVSETHWEVEVQVHSTSGRFACTAMSFGRVTELIPVAAQYRYRA